MPSYVVTGASRGLGWEFIRQLSSDTNNTVIGLVRNKAQTDKKVADELSGRTNLTILQADVSDYPALKKAASETAAITGGSLDYIIANAAIAGGTTDAFYGMDKLGEDIDDLTNAFKETMNVNVLGNIYLYETFLPLVLKGTAKKVVLISSGMADVELIREYEVEVGSLYSASKAAVNVINAKYSAVYKPRGVLFLSISPGVVDTGAGANFTPEQLAATMAMFEKFKSYAPHFTAPVTPAESVKAVLSVVDSCSIEGGHGGAFLSHLGTTQWL